MSKGLANVDGQYIYQHFPEWLLNTFLAYPLQNMFWRNSTVAFVSCKNKHCIKSIKNTGIAL